MNHEYLGSRGYFGAMTMNHKLTKILTLFTYVSMNVALKVFI